jgi:FkbM family methyltransferase
LTLTYRDSNNGLEENKVSNIHFTPVGIAGKSAIARFSPPENELEGSFTVAVTSDLFVKFQCKDLSCLMEERGHLYIDLLKIDIEGFEYEVIDEFLKINWIR